MALQNLGLLGRPQGWTSLGREWRVSSERARQIVRYGHRLFLRQTGTIDDLPLTPRAKRVLKNPGLSQGAAPFTPIITVEQFRTALPHIKNSTLLKYPKLGRSAVAEIRRVWRSYTGQGYRRTSGLTIDSL